MSKGWTWQWALSCCLAVVAACGESSSSDGGATGSGGNAGSGANGQDPPIPIPGCEDTANVVDASLDEAFTSDAITPSVTVNRATGMAPLAVFFDAAATEHSDASVEPFLDLHYQWYFHDDHPRSGGTWEYSCKSKRSAAGPLAAHVFEAPGQYSVRLAVQDQAGNVSSTTVDITVEDPEQLTTYCIADITGSEGDFSGCPLDVDGDGACDTAERCIDADDVTAALDGRLGDSTRILFRRGDVFRAPTLRVEITGGPGLVGAFGPETAARPVWQYEQELAGTIVGVLFTGARDWRVMDLEMLGDPGGATMGEPVVLRDSRDVLFYSIATRNWANFATSTHSGPGTFFSEHVFIVDVSYRDQLDPGIGWATFLELESSAVMGVFIEDTTSSEGGYRSMHSRKVLLQHSRIQRPAPTKQNISMRTCDNGPAYDEMCTEGLPTEEIIISDNVLVGTNGAGVVNVTAGPQRRYLFERNFIQYDETVLDEYRNTLGVEDIDGAVIRNNIVDFTVPGFTGTAVTFVNGGLGLEVYNNTVYWGNESGQVIVCSHEGGSCFNNLVYAPGADTRTFAHEGPVAENNLGDVVSYTGRPFAGDIPHPSSPSDFALEPAGAVSGTGPVDHVARPASVMVAIDDYFGHIRPVNENADVGAAEYTP